MDGKQLFWKRRWMTATELEEKYQYQPYRRRRFSWMFYRVRFKFRVLTHFWMSGIVIWLGTEIQPHDNYLIREAWHFDITIANFMFELIVASPNQKYGILGRNTDGSA